MNAGGCFFLGGLGLCEAPRRLRFSGATSASTLCRCRCSRRSVTLTIGCVVVRSFRSQHISFDFEIIAKVCQSDCMSLPSPVLGWILICSMSHVQTRCHLSCGTFSLSSHAAVSFWPHAVRSYLHIQTLSSVACHRSLSSPKGALDYLL